MITLSNTEAKVLEIQSVLAEDNSLMTLPGEKQRKYKLIRKLEMALEVSFLGIKMKLEWMVGRELN